MRTLLLAVALLCAWPQGAGEYVLTKKGSDEYHRPGCDVVRDTSDVVAMTRGEAESRGLKPHPACDPSKAHSDKAQTQYVFVAPGDKRYHRETCTKLGKTRERITLDEAARKKYWPCPACKPPVRKRGA
jgi:hypothetical protein